MSNYHEIFFINEDGTLRFGDYTLQHKTKVEDVEFEGDLFKVKTYKEITKLELNDMFLYESVPGSSVDQFTATADEIYFEVAAAEDIQIILEVAPDSVYEVFSDAESLGTMETNFAGKLALSLELQEGEVRAILVKRVG